MSSNSSSPQHPGRRRTIWLWVALIALTTAGWLAWQRWNSQGTASSQAITANPSAASGTPTSPSMSGPGPSAAPSPGGPPGTGGPGGARGGGANRALPVSAGAVQQRDIRVMQPAIGTIQALNTAVVRARVEGELRAIHFTEGQAIQAGQLLAEIDPRSFEVQLAQAEGQLARDQAQLANAQIDFARYRDLAARDSIARQQVDTQEALVKQLAATIRVNQAAVDNARLMLSYTRVTAPISGQVGLRQIDLGNVVRPGDTQGLVTITQTVPISVVFSVPEAALPRLRAGMRATQKPIVEAWDRELRSQLAIGAVSSLDNAIDPATGTIRVKAQFDNRDSALYPNQFVNIRLQLDLLTAAIAVPSTSLQRGASGSFVYRIGEDGVVTVRPVEPLATEGEWTAIRGSLAVGDRVVIDGADRLREGARVEVIQPARGPAASQSSPPVRAAGAPPTSGTTTERPPWLDRLPAEQQERFMKMSPEERQQFIDTMRERRRQQQGG